MITPACQNRGNDKRVIIGHVTKDGGSSALLIATCSGDDSDSVTASGNGIGAALTDYYQTLYQKPSFG